MAALLSDINAELDAYDAGSSGTNLDQINAELDAYTPSQQQPEMLAPQEPSSPTWAGIKGFAETLGMAGRGVLESTPAQFAAQGDAGMRAIAQLTGNPTEWLRKKVVGALPEADTGDTAAQIAQGAGDLAANLAVAGGVQGAVSKPLLAAAERAAVSLPGEIGTVRTALKAAPYVAKAVENAIGFGSIADPNNPASLAEYGTIGLLSGPFGKLAEGSKGIVKGLSILAEAGIIGAGPGALEGRKPTGGELAMGALPLVHPAIESIAKLKTPSRRAFAKVFGVKPQELPPELGTQEGRQAAVDAAKYVSELPPQEPPKPVEVTTPSAEPWPTEQPTQPVAEAQPTASQPEVAPPVSPEQAASQPVASRQIPPAPVPETPPLSAEAELSPQAVTQEPLPTPIEPGTKGRGKGGRGVQQEIPNAEGTGTQTQEAGPETGTQGETGGRLRVRNDEQGQEGNTGERGTLAGLEGPPPLPEGTSTKNANREADRIVSGKEPLETVPQPTSQESMDAARATIQSDPELPNRLVSELISGERRHISTQDEAVLNAHLRQMTNERDAAAREMANTSLSPDAQKRAGDRFNAAEEQISRLDQASKHTGSMWSDWGRFRQKLWQSDFSQAAIESKMRAIAKRPLLKPETDMAAEMAAKYESRQSEIEHFAAGGQTEEEINAALDEIFKEKPTLKGIGKKTGKAAEEFTKAWYELLGGHTVGITPTAFKEEAYAKAKPHFDEAWKLAKEAGKDAVDFAREMRDKFGSGVKPYVARYLREQKERVAVVPMDRLKEEAKAAAKAEKKTGKKTDLKSQRADIQDRMQTVAAEIESPEELRSLTQKLALNFVREGETQREPLIDKVHEFLSDIVPDISRSKTRDLISGYGDFAPLDKEAAKVTLRGLKGEMQQIGKIEDMQAGQAPKKTGVERREPTSEERRLIKEVNDLKRKGGFTVTDPETQLRTSMDAIKTRLRNEITDLDNAIAEHRKLPSKTSQIEYDAEAKRLRERRNELRKQYDEMFPKEPISEEERIRRTSVGLDRTIARLEEDLKQGQLYPKKGNKVSSPEIEAKRARLEALRAERDTLRKADTATQDAMALKAYKARVANRIADLKERIAKGDFAPRKRVRKEITHDARSLELQYELAKTKLEIRDRLFEWERAHRTRGQIARDFVTERLDDIRAVKTAIDLSAVGRQGALPGLGHPVLLWKNARRMLSAMRSNEAEFRVMQDILTRDNFPIYERSGLFMHDPTNPKLSSKEEVYRSRIAAKIPGVGASERAYTTYLNGLRADLFDQMYAKLARKGIMSADAEKMIAHFVNVATGRGTTQQFEAAMRGMSLLFFSPRFMISRIQYLVGEPLWGLGYKDPAAVSAARKIILTEYGKTMAGAGLVMTTAIAAGKALGIPVSVGIDPTSSDLGKIKVGDTRYDILGGITQYATLLARTIDAVNNRVKGKKPKYGQEIGDTYIRFIRYKFSPPAQTTANLVTGKTPLGQPITVGQSILDSIAPINMEQAIQQMYQQGMVLGTINALIQSTGIGVQTYDK